MCKHLTFVITFVLVFSISVIFSLPISLYSVNAEQNGGVICIVYEFHFVPEEKIRVGRDYQAVVPELIPLSGIYCIYCIHPFSHKCDIGHYIYKLHYILNI